jgi:hypothetical protein
MFKHITFKIVSIPLCIIAIHFAANGQSANALNKDKKSKTSDKFEALKEHSSTDVDSTLLKERLAQKKAAEWVASLQLNNVTKEDAVINIVATHLAAVEDWVYTHPFTQVPAGINPLSGRPLNEVDRKVIANSALPASVHQNLIEGLRKNLNEAQVDSILDKYTIGKVAFTMKAYREIVPSITPVEDSVLLSLMKQAREQAVDYSGMKQVSAIFEIYKTKAEQYLNTHGRNWREMYSSYTAVLKAKKAAEPQTASPNP